MSDQNDDADDDYLENLENLANKESAKIAPVAMVVPVHAATGPIKRGPGRPRKINPQPTVHDLAYNMEMQKRKAEFIDNDEVVNAVRNKQDPIDTLHAIKSKIAAEAASLHCDRIEASKYGRDVTQISTRMINALKEVAAIELEMRKMGATLLDLNSERFQKIFIYLIDTIREVAQETLTPEQSDLFMNRVGTALEGWEARAQNL